MAANWQWARAKRCHLKGNPPSQGSEYLHLLHLITLQCPKLLQLRKHNPKAIIYQQQFDVVLPLWARINGELVSVGLFSSVFSRLPVKELFVKCLPQRKAKHWIFVEIVQRMRPKLQRPTLCSRTE